MRRAVMAGMVLLAACQGAGGAFSPAEPLAPAVRSMVDSLMVEEQSARQDYAQVLAELGRVSPFTTLVAAQDDRVAQLLAVYRRYPAFPPAAREPAGRVPGSLAEACRRAAAAEQDVADRYGRALALRLPPDVERVLRRNRALTISGELSALRRCVG